MNGETIPASSDGVVEITISDTSNAVLGIQGNGSMIPKDKNNVVNITPHIIGAVPVTRTINGHSLADDVTISMTDFGGATAEQGAKADSAIQGIRGNGTIISPDGNKIVTVTPSNIGAATVNTYTATIGTDWTTAGTGEYTQTISIPEILETDNPIVDVVLDDEKELALSQLEAWGCISKIETSDGNITVTCLEDTPEVAIPIQLKAVR